MQFILYEKDVDYSSKLSSVNQLKLIVDEMKSRGNGELYELMMKYFNKGLPDFYQHSPMKLLMSDIREMSMFWISPNTDQRGPTHFFKMYDLYEDRLITFPAYKKIEIWASRREPVGVREIELWRPAGWLSDDDDYYGWYLV